MATRKNRQRRWAHDLLLDHQAGAQAGGQDLTECDVDYLKIAQSFKDKLTEDGSGRTPTEVVVDLAYPLGMEALAEGVETSARRDILAAPACDCIRGYYFSAAVPREAFWRLLEGRPSSLTGAAIFPITYDEVPTHRQGAAHARCMAIDARGEGSAKETT